VITFTFFLLVLVKPFAVRSHVLLLRYRAARLPRPPSFENDDATAPTFLLEIFFDFEDEEENEEDEDAPLKLEPFA
jgi:hypothetical protein